MRIKLIAPDERWQTSLSSGATFAVQKVGLPLLAALTPRRHEVQIVDECCGADHPEDRPDLVGITVMTEVAARAYRLADDYRSRGVRVVLGGVHPTVLPEEARAHADAVVIGEAEEAWPRLVRDVERGALQTTYRSRGPTDLQRVPIPDRTKYPRRTHPSFAPSAVGIETARGCPYDCAFCSVSRVMGRRLRHRPTEQVLREIEGLDGSNLFFVDDSFGLVPEVTRNLLRAMIPLRRRWVGQATVSLAEDLDLLRLMRRSGCHGLLIGFESVDPTSSAGLRKIRNLQMDFGEAMRRFHGEGIAILGAFVFGSDGESPAVFDATLEFILRHRLDGAQLRILTPYPGTRLYDRLDREGRLFDRQWWLHGYAPGTLLYRPRGMTPEQLVEGTIRVSRACYSLRGMLRRALGVTPWARGPIGCALYAGFNLGTRRRYFRGFESPQPILDAAECASLPDVPTNPC